MLTDVSLTSRPSLAAFLSSVVGLERERLPWAAGRGGPVELDLIAFDPPGVKPGIARFGKAGFGSLGRTPLEQQREYCPASPHENDQRPSR